MDASCATRHDIRNFSKRPFKYDDSPPTEAESGQSHIIQEPCRVALDFISQLYAVERAAPTRPAVMGDDDGARAEILALFGAVTLPYDLLQ